MFTLNPADDRQRAASALPLSVWLLSSALIALTGCSPAPDRAASAAGPYTDVIAQQTSPPDYPPQLACAGIGGTVTLKLSIDTNGVPTAVQTENGSGQRMLDAAAVLAVRKWQFKAATRGGQPVASHIRVPVTFTPPVMRPDLCFQLDEEQRRAQ